MKTVWSSRFGQSNKILKSQITTVLNLNFRENGTAWSNYSSKYFYFSVSIFPQNFNMTDIVFESNNFYLGDVLKLRNTPGGRGQWFVTNHCKDIGICTVFALKGGGVWKFEKSRYVIYGRPLDLFEAPSPELRKVLKAKFRIWCSWLKNPLVFKVLSSNLRVMVH
jgi:hypothetical protein